MPSRPVFSDLQVWALSVGFGLFGSLVGLLLLLAAYVMFNL